jgi:hypothetical protein
MSRLTVVVLPDPGSPKIMQGSQSAKSSVSDVTACGEFADRKLLGSLSIVSSIVDSSIEAGRDIPKIWYFSLHEIASARFVLNTSVNSYSWRALLGLSSDFPIR